jgi:hypothetical protein
MMHENAFYFHFEGPKVRFLNGGKDDFFLLSSMQVRAEKYTLLFAGLHDRSGHSL